MSTALSEHAAPPDVSSSSAPPSLRVFVPTSDADFELPFSIGAFEVRHDDDRPDHDNYLCLDLVGPGMRTGLILAGTNDEQVGRNIVLAALAHYAEHIHRLGWDPATLAGVTDELLAQIQRETYPRPHRSAEHESHPSSLRRSVASSLPQTTATDGGSRTKDGTDRAELRPAPVSAEPELVLGPGGEFARPIHLSV